MCSTTNVPEVRPASVSTSWPVTTQAPRRIGERADPAASSKANAAAIEAGVNPMWLHKTGPQVAAVK